MTDYPDIEWRRAEPEPRTPRARIRRWFATQGPIALALLAVSVLTALGAGLYGSGPTLALNEANATAQSSQQRFAELLDRQNGLTERAARETDPVKRGALLDRARSAGADASAATADAQRAANAAEPAYMQVQLTLAAVAASILLIVAGLVTGRIHSRKGRTA